jgi:hypothetical protein
MAVTTGPMDKKAITDHGSSVVRMLLAAETRTGADTTGAQWRDGTQAGREPQPYGVARESVVGSTGLA